MIKGSFSQSSPATKLLLTGCLVVICFLLMLFLGSILALVFFDANIFTQPDVLSENAPLTNLAIQKFFQTLYSLGLFVLPPFLLAYLFHYRTTEYLSLDRGAHVEKFIGAGLLIVFAIPLINLMADFNSHLSLPGFLSGVEDWMRVSEEKAKLITERFLTMNTIGDLLINLLIIALIPAIGEELLFRGVLQKLFAQWTKNIHWGIILAAIFFSALHLQFFGFLPRMMMGILFGYLLVWTKSLWIPITAHFINNAMAVISFYFIHRGTISEEVENIGSFQNYWGASIVSLVLTGLLIFLFYHRRER